MMNLNSNILAFTALLINMYSGIYAQVAESNKSVLVESAGATISNPTMSAEVQKGRFSLETSLTFPIVGIYMLKASHQFAERSELGLGLAFQNWKNDEFPIPGQAHAYTLLLSYRYFFWRNFNAEIEFWPAWNKFNSFIDGKTYKGPELWVEYKIGYKWALCDNFYLNIQPGLGHALWLQQNWPGIDKKPYSKFVIGSIIFVPQLVIGLKL